MKKMIKEKEFLSMTYEQQRDYIISLIKEMNDDEWHRFYGKVIESGILED